jgi:hypothetical protein
MKHTLGTAAIATGKSKSTIHRAVKNGKISAIRCDNGSYEIEPAELHRVYPPNTTTIADEQGATLPNIDKMAFLEEKIRILEREIVRMERTEVDLREDLNHWRRQATALLTYRPQREAEASPGPTTKKSGLLEKLFGLDRTKA